MARTRPADPPASKKHRPPMRHTSVATVTTDQYGEDPWAAAARGKHRRASPAKSLEPAKANDEDSNEQDEVALPAPIAQGLWKVTAPDGREALTCQPIPGFEHLLLVPGQKGSQGAPSLLSLVIVRQPPRRAIAAQDQVPATLKWQPEVGGPTQDRRRRIRSVTPKQTQQAAKDEEDDDANYSTSKVSYTMYIGNVGELITFFRRRFTELTMKPLRPIVTAWIKALEPTRLGSYGPYHKTLPKDQDPQCTPAWWPEDVRYEEPSHLNKSSLLKVAVELMLQHRTIDEAKRRKGSWVAKLQQAAMYAVETTPPDKFSSAKGPAFSEAMRERALKEILPSLFDVAQSYEDHFARHNLYEGTGNVDPGDAESFTWKPVSAPPRNTLTRKRVRKHTETSDCNLSGDETEIDNAASDAFLSREQDRARKRVQTLAAQDANTGSEQVTEPPRSMNTTHTTTPLSLHEEPRAHTVSYHHIPEVATTVAVTPCNALSSSSRRSSHSQQQPSGATTSLITEVPSHAPLHGRVGPQSSSKRKAARSHSSATRSQSAKHSKTQLDRHSKANFREQAREMQNPTTNICNTTASVRKERHPPRLTFQRPENAPNPVSSSYPTLPMASQEDFDAEDTAQQQPLPVFSATMPGHATTPFASLGSFSSHSSMTTPNTSFNRTMDDLRLGRDMDLDVKSAHSIVYNDPTLMSSLESPSQLIQFSTSPSYDGSDFQADASATSYAHLPHTSFGTVSLNEFAPFSVFDTPYLQDGNPSFITATDSNQNGFPYPFNRLVPANTNNSLNGLPLNYGVDDHVSQRHRF